MANLQISSVINSGNNIVLNYDTVSGLLTFNGTNSGGTKSIATTVTTIPFSQITSTPTTISGYGITDTTAQLLTGLVVSGTVVAPTDSILVGFGKLQNQVNALIGGATYIGTWNANTNTPTLTSSVGTKGYYYVVSVAGATNLDGITDWQIGDWAIFNGLIWEKVDNTDAITSVSGTLNRITVTAGMSPVVDISATFEALLGKVANPLSQFASTTSAQLLSIISDGTGSGSLVFSNSPTFIAPNIGTATGSVSGNSGTATALQTARTINGTSFDGTANITVTASAGTLSGTTLNSSVVTSSLTSVGTISSGVWNGTTIAVANGGTGASTFTAYSIICGGTTSTNPFQNVSGVGTLGQVLKSNGASALPTWQNSINYTEAFTLLTTPAVASTWTLTTVTGASANSIVEIMMEVTNNTSRTIGVREVGSALARLGGVNGNGATTSMLVKTNASSQIEMFTSVVANTEFYYIGVLS